MCSHGIRNRRNVSKLTRKLQFAPGHRRPDGDNSHYHSVSFRIIPSYILRLILWQVSHLCSHYALLMICNYLSFMFKAPLARFALIPPSSTAIRG